MAERVEYIISLKDLFLNQINKDTEGVKRFEKEIDNTQAKLGGFSKFAVGAFAGIGLAAFAKSVIDTTVQTNSLQNSLNFIAGSANEGGKTFEYLKKTSDSMGLSFMAAANGFKTIAGAARGTSLEGLKTRDIFEGVSMATTVMGLSAEQSEGALLALGQMISKGKVQAEELRGQLGERIPGAFQIAARAMNMTTAQLDKFMADGNLVAEQFLPRFAAQLKKEFAGGMGAASQSLQSNLNRLNNAWLDLKDTIGKDLTPVLVDLIGIAKTLIGFLKDNWGWIKRLGIAFATLKLSIGATNIASSLFSRVMASEFVVGMRSATTATGFLSVGIRGIGAALKAVPIVGWIALAIEGLMYLWDNFEGFRASIYAFGQGLKDAFGSVWEFIKDAASSIGKLLKGAFTLDFKMISQGMKEQATSLMKFTDRQRLSLIEGYNKGSASFQEDKKNESSLGSLTDFSANSKSYTVGGGSGSVGNSGSSVTGSQTKNIYITVDKLVETINNYFQNAATNASNKIQQDVERALLTVVNDANILAGQ